MGEQSLDRDLLVGNPLENRIRQEQVDGFWWCPLGEVGDVVIGQPIHVLADRLGDHLGRRVDTEDQRFRPSLAEMLGVLPRATPEVDDGRRIRWHFGDQIEEGAGTSVGEL